MVLSLFPVTLLVSLNFAPLETVLRSRATGLSFAGFAAAFATTSVVLLRDYKGIGVIVMVRVSGLEQLVLYSAYESLFRLGLVVSHVGLLVVGHDW